MSAIYRCQHCGCITDISSTLSAFEENPYCRQCGLSVSESDDKMQDDLAAMMARNLHLSTVNPPHDSSMSAPPTPQVVPQPAPITYISQHYHHSYHIAPVVAAEAQASTILENAGVNASALLPSQLQLFRNAQADQQQRLIELWRIAPPTPGSQFPGEHRNWPQSSMEQEEAAAHSRWLSQEQEKIKSLSTLQSHGSGTCAEPYMQNGYEGMPNINGMTAPSEYRQSTDPVYQGSREWWQVGDQQPMEHQYGMLQQLLQRQEGEMHRGDGHMEM